MLPFYYCRIQEKVEIALLDMFNNLIVNKYNDLSRTTYTKTIKVPIVINQDKNFSNWYRNIKEKKPLMPVPIGGLRFVSKEMNSENRTQSTYPRRIYSESLHKWIQDIQPTPYRMIYNLEFLTDNVSDWHQIVENIIPYFNTFRTLRIKEFDFAPDIERKIPVYLSSAPDKIEDEVTDAKHRFYIPQFTLRLDVDWYRPFELPEMIKYAQMNIHNGIYVNSQQVFVYPDEIAQAQKKEWEVIEPSIRKGYSLLKTMASTLIEESNENGIISYADISVPDSERPASVPSFEELHLNFDYDVTPEERSEPTSKLETDRSGFGRDFKTVNEATPDFINDIPPGNGKYIENGYTIDPTVEWSQILNWFGTNNGLNESPFTFQISLQFNTEPVCDTIFQYMANKEIVNSETDVIPEGSVYFDWGIMDSHLYFSFKTYGTHALIHRFTTVNEIELNSTDIYKFVFVLYNEGNDGMFGYTINNQSMIALKTEKQ